MATCLAKLNSKGEFHGCTADKVKGATNEAIGKAKQGVGEAIGSDAAGRRRDPGIKGKGQKAVGDAKEATKDASTRPPRRTRISDRARRSNERPA